jgi:hypothetical protein
MDLFNSILHAILGGIFKAFSWAPAAGLIVISSLAGVAMLWTVGKTSNQDQIRSVKRRVFAHILELRVFRDEPRVMWRAQKSLFAANMRYIGLMLLPVLWMGLPFAVLLVHVDAFYGRSPLPVGRESIVTVAMRSPLDAQAPEPMLAAPPGVAVETPAVRVMSAREVSWRIRPLRPVSGELRLTLGAETIAKRIEAGSPPGFVPGRRVSSVFEAIWHPDEARIQSRSVEWVDVRYPEARVKLFGIRAHWLIWFVVFSMALALVLRKRFGVVI